MTGIKSKTTDLLLIFSIIICIMAAFANCFGFIYGHTPPYNVGECFESKTQGVVGKIMENYILEGYSEVSAGKQNGPIPFIELRHPSFKKVECPK